MFNCNLHELSISTYRQLCTVIPYLFNSCYCFLYLYIGSLVSFYDYFFIHCIVTRTYIICILHSIVRINNGIELNRSIVVSFHSNHTTCTCGFLGVESNYTWFSCRCYCIHLGSNPLLNFFARFHDVLSLVRSLQFFVLRVYLGPTLQLPPNFARACQSTLGVSFLSSISRVTSSSFSLKFPIANIPISFPCSVSRLCIESVRLYYLSESP